MARVFVFSGGLAPAAEGEGGVEAAEGERVGEGVFDFCGTGLIGDDIKGAFGVERSEIDGRWQEAVLKREDRGDGFQAASGSERVAMHRFGGADRDMGRVRAEDDLRGGSFGGIVQAGGGAVGVEVGDLGGIEAGVGEGGLHGAGHARFRGLREVMRVGGHPEANDLAVDGRASRLRVLQRLQGQDRRAFA